jgi:hypothetical protein
VPANRSARFSAVRAMPIADPNGNAIAQAKTAIRMVLPKPETIQPKYGSFSRMGQFQL